MNEKCLLGHINLSKEQLGLPARGIIVKKPEILRKKDYESSVIFTVQVPIPYISTSFSLLFPGAEGESPECIPTAGKAAKPKVRV